MYSLGFRTERKTQDGLTIVSMYINKQWEDYILANEPEIPEGEPNFGLYHKHPTDQYCYWTDCQKILERAVII